MAILNKFRFKEKRVLVVYPHNPFEHYSGSNKMFYYYLRYLKSRGFMIDLLSLKNYEYHWNENSKFDGELVDDLILFDYLSRIKHPPQISRHLPDLSNREMCDLVKSLQQKRDYSHILVSYAFWGNVIADKTFNKVKKVIAIHDFLTVQLNNPPVAIDEVGQRLTDEIRSVNLFDYAISISEFEYSFFKNFTTKPKHVLVPIFFDPPRAFKQSYTHDIGFIGFSNPHNIAGINWFLNSVWRKHKELRVVIVGKVIEKIKHIHHKNIGSCLDNS